MKRASRVTRAWHKARDGACTTALLRRSPVEQQCQCNATRRTQLCADAHVVLRWSSASVPSSLAHPARLVHPTSHRRDLPHQRRLGKREGEERPPPPRLIVTHVTGWGARRRYSGSAWRCLHHRGGPRRSTVISDSAEQALRATLQSVGPLAQSEATSVSEDPLYIRFVAERDAGPVRPRFPV